ncbi:MAG: hypothetical protein QW134_05725 [Nitrososphaeria archaeon]
MNESDRLIKIKQGSKFLLTMLNKIAKTIKENGENYKTMDMGEHYVCYLWSTANICALVAHKQNTKDDYVIYITFNSDDINTNLALIIDTETRTVKMHSMILSFLMKRPTKAPLILKNLNGLKEFIEELIEAIPNDEEEQKGKSKDSLIIEASVAHLS